MQRALAGGLGQHGGGDGQRSIGQALVLALNRVAHILDGVLHAGAGGTVAGGPVEALLVTFDG